MEREEELEMHAETATSRVGNERVGKGSWWWGGGRGRGVCVCVCGGGGGGWGVGGGGRRGGRNGMERREGCRDSWIDRRQVSCAP